MSDADKVDAFDALALALTNRWYDGWWSWWNPSPCGGPMRMTRSEAVADLVAWAHRMKNRRRMEPNTRMPLEVVSVPV